MKKAAVIIPNWNGRQYLENCLNSLRAQSFRSFEVYVIDNGSKDGSTKMVTDRYPEVKLHCFQENTGFCHAVNTGIKISREPYIILLNNDTVADPEMTGELVKAISSRPKAFSCQAKMLSMAQRDVIDDAGDMYCALGWAYAMGRGRKEERYNRPERIFASCGGASIYRRSLLEKTGLFDEAHFAYLEDIDLCYRAAVYGYASYLAPKARVWHAGSSASGSKYNRFKVSHSSRNNVYMLRKNMPAVQRLINLPFLIAGFGIKLAWFTKKGFGKEYASGLFKGLTMPVEDKKVRFSPANLVHYADIQLQLWKNTLLRLRERA